MNEELYGFEDVDGIRMPWNVWPRSRVEAHKCVLPFSMLYTPLKQTRDLQVLNYSPVPCKSCMAIVSPYATVDYSSKMWVCPHCTTRNYFPSIYSQISQNSQPMELTTTTLEYLLPNQVRYPPIVIFIVDTAVSEDELEACKAVLVQALQMMPEDTLIGLVSFGKHVHVHELQQSAVNKVYVFRGTGTFAPNVVASQLGFRAIARQKAEAAADGMLAIKFLVPLDQAEYQISSALEGLQPDVYPPASDHRKARCTGTAVQVAAGLAATGVPGGVSSVRIMLFVGGPCTEGPAAIVGKELSKMIRSHKDLEKDDAPFFRPAVAFYEKVCETMVTNSHTLDVFACALEQSGVAEMKPAVQATGGYVVQTDTFRNPVFKESLARVFASEVEAGFLGRCTCGTLDVFCSRDIKVQGLLGCAASMRKSGQVVSSTSIGAGKTSQWRLPSLDRSTTVCVVFEITAERAGDKAKTEEAFHVQFSLRYLHWDGSWRQRVTTVSRRWAPGSAPHDLLHAFDQEAAAVVLTRVITWKMETEEDFDATRWIDRCLIRLCQRFGSYTKEDARSFTLAPELTYYPGFMFHLRRSQFVQVFGNSPDETAFARLMLMREYTQNCIIMIQPQLFRYALGEEAAPALLDVQTIMPDYVLFLDTYFYLVVYHGTNIARWRQEGYHHKPEYEDFAELLKQPQDAATNIIKSRFPVPRLVDSDDQTVKGRSQSRFLKVKLNPSSTHQSTNGPGEVILTDDVSLEVFLTHLKTLAVQS